MKKLLLATLSNFLLMPLMAQDTTNSRMVFANSNPPQVIFAEFDGSWSTFTKIDKTGFVGYVSLFTHPQNGRLYTSKVDAIGTERSIYALNPLNANLSLAYDVETYFSSFASSDEKVYGLHGNALSTNGAVFEIDIMNESMSSLYQSSIDSGASRAMIYNEQSDALHILSPDEDSMYVYDISSGQETAVEANFNGNIKGATYRNDTIIFTTANNGDIGLIDLSLGNNQIAFQDTAFSGGHLTGVAEITLVDAEQNITVCSGDTLSALYPSNSYQWYRNGEKLVGETSQSIILDSSGIYRLVTQIGDSARYIWSERINVNIDDPLVTITPTNAAICGFDSVLLTGASGGTLQWMRNGNPISGATGSTYYAKDTGTYNQMKTTAIGCTGVADEPSMVSALPVDSCAPAGIESASQISPTLYPNPVGNNLTVVADKRVNDATIFNLTGNQVLTRQNLLKARFEMNTSNLPSGIYVLEVETSDQRFHERFVKRD